MKRIALALMAVAAMATALSPQAYAQFGLGKVKNKIVKTAKDKAREVTSETATTTNTASAVTEDGVFDPYRTYTPSAEALAADRYASDQTVKNGFTKSVGQIHATYEHLDAIYTREDGVHAPYQPYYTLGHMAFYFTGTGLDDTINETFGKMLMKAIAADAQNIYWITDYIAPDENNPSVVVPKDEMFVNALSCQYIADPKSIFAFELYLKVDMYLNCFSMQCKLGLDDEIAGKVDKDHILPAKYKQWVREREWAAQDLASRYISYAEMVKLADKYYKLYSSATDPVLKLMHFLVFDRLVEAYLPKTPGFTKSDDAYRLAYGRTQDVNRGALYQDAMASKAEPVAEPKSVAVGADIKRLAEKAAREYVTSGTLEKIIYLEAQWHPFKNPKWPYNIIAYGLPCAVVTVENGKRYLQKVMLTKDAKTSKAFMQADTDSAKRPLK